MRFSQGANIMSITWFAGKTVLARPADQGPHQRVAGGTYENTTDKSILCIAHSVRAADTPTLVRVAGPVAEESAEPRAAAVRTPAAAVPARAACQRPGHPGQ